MSGAWSISWLYQPLFSGASPANTTSGRWARTAAGSAVINCVSPGPHVTVATPTSQFFRAYAIAAASAQCSCLTYTMRHPSSDKRAAQFMFASPRSAKHVRTSSCAKALARMSYTRGLASFFIVATPASNCLLNREHITADGETPSRDGTTHLVMSPLEFMWPAAIFASTALSPSALSARGPGRAAAFFTAFLVVLLADFCVPFAWASLPGASFSDISVSFLVAFRRLTAELTCERCASTASQVERIVSAFGARHR